MCPWSVLTIPCCSQCPLSEDYLAGINRQNYSIKLPTNQDQLNFIEKRIMYGGTNPGVIFLTVLLHAL